MSLRENLERRAHLWAALLILVPAALRFWFVATNQLDLVQDEAQYWDWTRRLQFTYYSKGPLIAWIIALGAQALGNTELGVRAGSLAGSVLVQVLLYLWLALGWKRPRTGVLTLLVLNTSPLFLALGVLMTTDNPLVLCWAGAMVALYAAVRPAAGSAQEAPASAEPASAGPDPEALTLAGPAPADPGQARFWPFFFLALSLAVGILAKYTMLAVVPGAVAFALGCSRFALLPRGVWPRLWKALAAGLALGFLPTLAWNALNGFVGYKHVLHLIGVSGTQAAALFNPRWAPEYLGSQAGLATPWWLWFMLAGGGLALRALWTRGEPPLGLTRPQALLLVLFFWPLWAFMLAWSLHTKVLPNWTTPAYVAGAVLAALAFERFLARSEAVRGRGPRRIVLAALAVAAILHLQNFLPLPAGYNPASRLKGWTSLGQELEALRQGMPDPGRVFFFSEDYDLTAALAFYVPGQPRTYCVWLDRRMNQYDLWPGPQDKAGWDALYVRKGTAIVVEPGVEALFAEIGPPLHIQSTHRGAPARTFTVFRCRGYTGAWPRDDQGRF